MGASKPTGEQVGEDGLLIGYRRSGCKGPSREFWLHFEAGPGGRVWPVLELWPA